MKEVIKDFNVDVPMTLRGISLKQYKKWLKIVEKYDEAEMKDDNYLKAKMLQVFCNLPVEDTYKIPLNNFDGLLVHLTNLFKEEPELKTRWSMIDPDGKELDLGLIPDLHKTTVGEYIDF